MFESFVLGAVQGIAEWLPVSSEAMIILVKNNFFPDTMNLAEMISFAIFLHLGTLLAVVVYYQKKISLLFQNLRQYRFLDRERKNYVNFIIITTGVSGTIGLILLQMVEQFEYLFSDEIVINYFVAGFLMITAVMLFIAENADKTKNNVQLNIRRAIGTGIFQGFAVIPGVSRSGSTVAGMALLGIDKKRALELSFLLSVPLVFLANIVLNFSLITNISLNHIVALSSAFVFGFITIELLLRLVQKIRFSYFVGFFAILLLVFTNMLS